MISESRESSAEKIYWLKREVLEFYRGIVPLSAALDEILSGRAQKRPVSAELHPYFRDVDDRLHRIVGRVENARELLTAALEANLAKISVQQNNDMRAISSWAAIIAVPTMLAGIWGMNFRHMPEIDSRLGYPLALATMIGSALLVWWRLRKSGWL